MEDQIVGVENAVKAVSAQVTELRGEVLEVSKKADKIIVMLEKQDEKLDGIAKNQELILKKLEKNQVRQCMYMSLLFFIMYTLPICI